METNLVCKNRTAALGVLDAMANNMPRGTQRAALLAVRQWMVENTPRDFDPETAQRMQRIFDETFDEAAQKAITWEVHGGEPEHGTRIQVPFLFNADTKIWELEKEMPPVWTEPNPNILPQSDEGLDDDENPGK